MGAAVSGVVGSVLGTAGQVVGGVLSSSATRSAANRQAGAIQSAMDSLSADLDPTSLNDRAVQFDLERARARIQAQRDIDPELANQRQLSQQMLTGQLQELGGTTASDTIAQQAATEAMQSGAGFSAGKQALIDAALQELKLGASLPPDVQAEIMKAGLETAGNVTGEAASRGAGANILKQTLGLGALNLKAQRQAQAEKMLTAASGIDAQRQSILQSLFPNLQAQQLNKMKATSGVLTQADSMLPEAGLSGSDITNLWLARTGALNQLASNKATVTSQGALTSNLQMANAIGGGISGLGNAVGGGGGLSSFFSSVFPGGGSNAGIGASGNFAG